MVRKGDRVKIVNCIEVEKNKEKVFTVITDVSEVCGQKVVWLEGYSGCFSANKLEVVRE